MDDVQGKAGSVHFSLVKDVYFEETPENEVMILKGSSGQCFRLSSSASLFFSQIVSGVNLRGMSIPRSLLRYLVCPIPVAVSAATPQRRLAAALFLIPRSLLRRRFH